MEKQISFLGTNLTPYNSISPDGQLSLCNNLERHSGSVRPIILNGTSYHLSAEYYNLRLLCVHSTSDFEHFIFYNDNNGELYWCIPDINIDLSPISFGLLLNIQTIKTVGNTLIAINEDGIHYFFFEIENGNYTDLGDIPEISLNFGLKALFVGTGTFDINFDAIQEAYLYDTTLSESNQRTITDQVMSQVNAFISEKGNETGRFIFPFFVRYALHLYDDKLIHHSAPIFMICTSGINPVAYCTNFEKDVDIRDGIIYKKATIHVAGAAHTLDYQCSNSNEILELKKWKDIIKSVDIFISQQIYTLQPDGLCTAFSKNFSGENNNKVQNDDYCVALHTNKGTAASSEKDYYQLWHFSELYLRTYSSLSESEGKIPARVLLPSKSEESIAEEIRNTSNFYLLKKIYIDELTTERKEIKPDKDYLKNLSFKEKMTDDYLSHEQLIPKFANTYNQRLNLANIKRKIFSGFNTESLFCYSNGYWDWWGNNDSFAYTVPVTCYVYVKENGKDIIVKNQCNLNYSISLVARYLYFFYPNVSAYKAVILSQEYTTKKILVLSLAPHNFLNGSFFFAGFDPGIFEIGSDITVSSENQRIINLPNKLYTSEVGNPYYFPLEGINTIGIGEIIGIAAITTALSQGQFGSYSLMVFCSDGNYAMKVNSEGLFSEITPMQRDVCISAETITIIDSSIIYISSRGVMNANGATIECLSEVLNGVADIISLPEEISDISLSPNKLFKNCLIAYDYAGKRIIFFSKSENTAWILSLEDTTWSQAQLGSVTSIVNIYPYSYIQFSGTGIIQRLDQSYSFNEKEYLDGYLLTRPLKLDSLQLKSISQIALEGDYSEPQTMELYGSNDGIRWNFLGKTTARRVLVPGCFFKYYRLGIKTSLNSKECISGLRIEYTLRTERRLR